MTNQSESPAYERSLKATHQLLRDILSKDNLEAHGWGSAINDLESAGSVITGICPSGERHFKKRMVTAKCERGFLFLGFDRMPDDDEHVRVQYSVNARRNRELGVYPVQPGFWSP